MNQEELDALVDERGKQIIAAAQLSAAADQPVLEQANLLIAMLRAERTENHWAIKVRKAFRESRG